MAADEASGLALPEEIARERAEEQRREEAKAEIERRRKGRRDRMVNRKGSLRKGAHTQSRYRGDANRRRGLKGITGA